MADTPSATVTPLEGKTTIDDHMFFEPERLSYESAERIAKSIVSEIGSVEDKVVVIAGTPLLADLANLESSYLELDNLAEAYESVAELGSDAVKRRWPTTAHVEAMGSETLLTPTLSAALIPATTFINAAIGLAALFRTNVEYHGSKTTVDTLAFEIAVAAQVKSKKAKKVIVPNLMVLPTGKSEQSQISARLAKVQEVKTRAWAAIGPLISELVRLESQLDEAASEKNQDHFNQISRQVSDLRRDLQPVSDPVSACDRWFADLQNRWNEHDESGLSLLARMLRAEAIKSEQPIYLHAVVVSSGGHHRITRSLWSTMFSGDGLSFAGGATVRWALLDDDGSVKKGGIRVEPINNTV